MRSRRLGWWLSGAGVVLGAFAMCAGIPLGVVYLLAQAQPSFLVGLAAGVIVWLLAMRAAGAVLGRLQDLHVRLGPPPPPGLQPGSILLEASVVVAGVATIIGIVVWAVTRAEPGGGIGPIPG